MNIQTIYDYAKLATFSYVDLSLVGRVKPASSAIIFMGNDPR
jgi:hypothetical protein